MIISSKLELREWETHWQEAYLTWEWCLHGCNKASMARVCLSSNLLCLQWSPGNARLGQQDETLEAPKQFYSALHDEEEKRQDNEEQTTKSHCYHSTNNIDSDWRGEARTTCMQVAIILQRPRGSSRPFDRPFVLQSLQRKRNYKHSIGLSAWLSCYQAPLVSWPCKSSRQCMHGERRPLQSRSIKATRVPQQGLCSMGPRRCCCTRLLTKCKSKGYRERRPLNKQSEEAYRVS